MKKYIFLILIISGLILPMTSLAGDFSGPLVPCGTKANPTPCTLCDLFTMIQTIIDFVSAGIFVLAAIFITIGGLMILLTGANPGNLELGKKMITNAIIGVIISLLAWTVINVVFNTLVGDNKDFPAPWNKIECVGGGVVPDKNKICTCGENKKIGFKEFTDGADCLMGCSNYCEAVFGNESGGDYGCCNEKVMENGCFASSPAGEWCERPAPVGSEKWVLSGINSNQKGDASASLVNFINCMYKPENGLTNLKINSISDDKLCLNPPSCDTATGTGCSHTKNSCHYGGTNCSGGSNAVDFGTSVSCKDIERVARYCAGSNAWINWENNHTHISINNGTCGCNEKGAGTPCPQ